MFYHRRKKCSVAVQNRELCCQHSIYAAKKLHCELHVASPYSFFCRKLWIHSLLIVLGLNDEIGSLLSGAELHKHQHTEAFSLQTSHLTMANSNYARVKDCLQTRMQNHNFASWCNLHHDNSAIKLSLQTCLFNVTKVGRKLECSGLLDLRGGSLFTWKSVLLDVCL